SLVIRGGTVVDGSGGPPRKADVAIADGRIAAIGEVTGAGTEEIDARGKLVIPGFVDVHTHYDAQVTWTNHITPSSCNGVTTAVLGNCGVGFAPCRPDQRDMLVRLMEGVEDIPFPVLTEGLPWNWESFPDYLDALEQRAFDIDLAAQLPHAALRVYVMGERGANREPATADDIAQMAAIAERAMQAGAIGFSTSRTLNHRTSDGEPTPTLNAGEDELTGIALGMAAAGKGVLQLVSDFAPDPAEEVAMFRRIAEKSGRPLSFTLAQSPKAPELWKMLLGKVEAAVDDGVAMKAQVCGRPVGVLFGLELTLNPFSGSETYKAIAHLPLAERVEAMSDAGFRARLLSETSDAKGPFRGSMLQAWDRMWLLDEVPDYEQPASRTVQALAAGRGVWPEDLALDHMLSNGGRGMLYHPFLNYADNSLDPSYAMLGHRDTVPGLSDGGAHVGMICDGSFPTSMLTHWTRDRTRGPKFRIEEVVRMQTRDTAEAVGLLDRGLIAPGLRADLNVIDYEGLKLHAPGVSYDLPAGGRRLTQKAEGYVATVVAGVVTYRDGQPTGALPGRLVRGAQPAPVAMAAE
ncbi:MAG TPA: amidohydrolase family protein, partial [Caulobacter sp.]|nr:amidohydrolase family protein [Caulobacter sp.]